MSRLIDRRDALKTGALVLAATAFTGATPAIAQQTDDSVVGTVARLQASAVAMQNAFPRILAEGDPILLGDVISTSAGARLQLSMTDGGELTLGEGTIFVVQEYIMSQGGNNAVMRLLQGAFVATSGAIMQQADASFVVETELATIGIRGTTFWGGSLDGEFSVLLLGGKGVYVETSAGRVDLSEAGAGTSVLDGSTAPSTPKAWGAAKIDQAKSTVTFGAN